MKHISALCLLFGLLFVGTACERHPIAQTLSAIEEKEAEKPKEEKPCPDCTQNEASPRDQDSTEVSPSKEAPTVEVHPTSEK